MLYYVGAIIKPIGFFLLFLFVLPTLTARLETGIQFHHNEKLENIMQESSDKNRFLFIHTTSGACGGCNYLAQKVYPDKQVGDFYNDNFINYTLNVDKLEHENMAKILNLGSQAVVLYFEPGGKLVKKAANISTAQELMHSAQEVMYLHHRTPDNQQKLSYLNQRVKNNMATGKEMREYAYLLNTFNYPTLTAVNQYLRTLSAEQLTEPDNSVFVYDMLTNVESMATDVLLSNLTFFKRHYGAALNDKLLIAIYNSLNIAIKQRDNQLFERILTVLDRASLPDGAEKKYFIQSQYYEEIKDFKSYENLAAQYLARAGRSNARLMVSVAEKFFAYLSSNSAYNNALNWVNEAIKMEGNSYQKLLLKARLLRKLQTDCTEALIVAKQAKDLAMEDNIDTYEIDNLVHNMLQGGCKQP